MSNHIKAKYLGIAFGKIQKEIFEGMIPELIEALRSKLPTFSEEQVNAVKFQMTSGAFNTEQEHLGKELIMTDASGLWGIKVGNQGIAASTSAYVSFEESMEYIQEILASIEPILKISYYSQVWLKNSNLFEEINDSPNTFKDIKDDNQWGRQELNTLDGDFSCAGAATKHIYLSTDKQKQIHVISSIVMPSQTYIGQEEWATWQLRGNFPTVETVHLMIDIFGSTSQAPGQQSSLKEYSRKAIRQEFVKLRSTINDVYNDITED